jgi:hypothetical protein
MMNTYVEIEDVYDPESECPDEDEGFISLVGEWEDETLNTLAFFFAGEVTLQEGKDGDSWEVREVPRDDEDLLEGIGGG